MIFSRVIIWVACASICLAGCADPHFTVPETTLNDAVYESLYPWYAEFCALSEISKKPGFGAEVIAGGPGGHSVIYLNGVCRAKDAGYPVVALCDGKPKPGEGVGLSVNAHYSNANWIATPGRNFVFHGDLRRGEPLTRASYLRTQAKAEAMGILDGVAFHHEVFDDQPAGMAKTDFMYDMSVATDYAVGFGRDRYCARVPLDRAKMAAAVKYLNTVNAPYRSGKRTFVWDVLENNCAHLAHNVLAIAGIWPVWPTDRPWLISAFDFPVPKNEFVNLMRRTNDMPIDDPGAIYDDRSARASVMRYGLIGTRPGGLAEAERVVQRNEVYNTKLRLIFYDEPVTGHYQARFDEIFKQPRYTNLGANLHYFSTLYTSILAGGTAEAKMKAQGRFGAKYRGVIAAEKVKLDAALQLLSGVPGERS